jgi:hypothetical protein
MERGWSTEEFDRRMSLVALGTAIESKQYADATMAREQSRAENEDVERREEDR